MVSANPPRGTNRPPNLSARSSAGRLVAYYEHQLRLREATELQLRGQLAVEEVVCRQMGEQVKQQEALSQECDRRLLDCLQIMLSLLTLQGRAAENSETSAQLALAANRVATIERVHRKLHCDDGVRTVAFRDYLEELCSDFSGTLCLEESPRHVRLEHGFDLDLSAETAIPVGFIVNEFITNAAKHGEGAIVVAMEPTPDARHVVSVINDGPSLPENFDPARGGGLGMRIIGSLVRRIGGELQIGRGAENRGTRFAVLFSPNGGALA